MLAALAAYPLADADRLEALLAGGGAAAVALLALALVARAAALVPFALVLVGSVYAALPYLGGDRRVLPAAGAGLVLCAELAYWALEPAITRRPRERALTIVAAALCGGAGAAAVASVSNEPFSGGLVVEAAGVAAAVIAVAVLVVLARLRATASR